MLRTAVFPLQSPPPLLTRFLTLPSAIFHFHPLRHPPLSFSLSRSLTLPSPIFHFPLSDLPSRLSFSPSPASSLSHLLSSTFLFSVPPFFSPSPAPSLFHLLFSTFPNTSLRLLSPPPPAPSLSHLLPSNFPSMSRHFFSLSLSPAPSLSHLLPSSFPSPSVPLFSHSLSLSLASLLPSFFFAFTF